MPAARARPSVENVRQRLQALIKRPALPAGSPRATAVGLDVSAPGGLTGYLQDDIVWERWAVQSEPGDVGRVPVLLAHLRAQVGRCPAVIIMHGTGQSKEDHADDLARYASAGFLAASFDNRYLGERGGVDVYFDSLVRAWRGNWQGDEAQAPQPGDEHPYIYDNVWDLSQVIDMLVARQDVDPTRIGATGISLGGMTAWLGAVADPRIAAVAPAIGVQGFRFAVEQECWHARVESIRKVFEAAAADLSLGASMGLSRLFGSPEITAHVVEQVWRRICPGLMDELDAPSSLRCIAPRPLLVVNGSDDPRCPSEGVRLALVAAEEEYRHVGAPTASLRLHFEKGVAHQVTREMWAAIDAFFVEHLRPEVASRPRGAGAVACCSCWEGLRKAAL